MREILKLLKSRMREILKSGSVRGLIVTSGPLPQTRGALWALLDIEVFIHIFQKD